MDAKRLIGEVAARHGVRLDPDDPALVLVTISELVLQQAKEEFVAAARQASVEFVEAAGRVQDQAGAALAERVRAAGLEWRAEFERTLGGAWCRHQDAGASVEPATSRWIVGRFMIELLIFVIGMIVGRTLSR
jgi:hypothetical protein